jgi:predicted ribosome quality control (RQC) complex YloA/Tae2 family protein
MDRKRELTSVDVAAVVTELRAYQGAHFRKAYLYPDRDLLRLKLRDRETGRIEVLVEVGELKRAHVTAPDRVPDAPERPPNFAKMIRNRLEGARLAGVEQHAFDRVIRVTFERGGETTAIVAELFGDGNLAVVDPAGDVIDSLRTVRLKSRTVAPGAAYEFPEARFDPFGADEETFARRIRTSDADLVRTIATQLEFGGTWGEELCTRAGLAYDAQVGSLEDDDVATLYRHVADLGQRLGEGDLDPRVYYERPETGGGEDGDQRRPIDVTPVPLHEYDEFDEESVDSFNEALDEYFTALSRIDEGTEEAGGDRGPEFTAEIEKRERIIAQQESAIQDFDEQAERERSRAELLYSKYDLVDGVLSTIQEARDDGIGWEEIGDRFEDGAERGIPAAAAVQTVDGSEGTVTLTVEDEMVTLDATMGVEHNADRLYQEAKRIEEKKAGAEEAIAETREELAALEERRDAWEAGADDGPEADDTASEGADGDETDWLARSSIPIRQEEQWYEEFRWFHTTNDFLVIGGRNADQNEAIVSKYLDAGDRFFHAQAHGGPATVLKATGPSEPARDVDIPDQDLEEAAQFAVSYSSVWKDGRFAGDAYVVDDDQVTKTPESGEYLEKGGFAIRGDREYFRDVAVGVAVGVTCEPETRVIGGPPPAIEQRAVTTVELEPGRFAQNDTAKRVYRELKDRFVDDAFVRKVASADRIQEFLPPGCSTIVDAD